MLLILWVVSEEVPHDTLLDLNVGQLLAAIGTLGLIIGIFRKVLPVAKRLGYLLDDWFGEDARPGVPKRKGVMERLSDQDRALDKVTPMIDETTPGNHAEVLGKLDQITDQTLSNAGRLKRLEKLLQRHIRESKLWVDAVTKQAAASNIEAPPWPDLKDDEKEPDEG